MTSRRPLWVKVIVLIFTGGVFITLVSLGNWQMERLRWKQDLIASVEARAYAAPAISPVISPAISPTRAPDSPVPQYTRVMLEGVFQHELSLRVKAVTELGPGYWLMTPLESSFQTVWVNRGFIPTGLDAAMMTTPKGQQQVTGLVRPSKPMGTWLEKNEPENARWYSADLPVMSETVGINDQPGYFVDVEANEDTSSWPRGGMTKLRFRNTHLAYAITWYAMAALLLGGVGYVVWNDRVHQQD